MIQKRAIQFAILAAFLFSLSSSVLAQEDDFSAPAPAPSRPTPSTDKKVITRYQHRSYFDFEDTLIRGKVLRPAGSYIYSRQHASFITKIKLKRSFMPELKSTASGE